MKTYSFDAVVIGSGAAGFATACNIAKIGKKKYNIIPKESDSISVVIDTSYGRVCDVNLFFTFKLKSFT